MLPFKKRDHQKKEKRDPILITNQKGSPLPPEALEWFRFHFPQNSSFDGFFQLCYRGKKGFRTLWTGVQDNMEEFLSKMRILNKSDYYLSANCTTTVKRNKEKLFALQNIVIDLDCHLDHLHPIEKDQLFDNFLFRFQEYHYAIPLPHTIVKTGRGLQLWWAIHPIHAKCLPYYDRVKQYFLHLLQEILEEYTQELSDLKIDRAASLNAVGVFRLPGTNNDVGRRKVSWQRTSVEKPYHIRDLEKIMEENKEEFDFNPKNIQKKNDKNANLKKRNCLTEEDPFLSQYLDEDIAFLEKMDSFTYFRSKQLLQLRLLRNLPQGAEERNNFSLLIYSALRASFPHKESWERLTLFNKGFKKPLTEAELENVISSAQHKEGYRFSNERVISFLDITQEEREKIGLYSVNDDTVFEVPHSHMNRDHYNKLKKDYQRLKIFTLYQEGKKTEEIAKEAGCSKSTVTRWLKPHKDAEKLAIYQEIKEKLGQGISYAQIIAENHILQNLSDTSKYRYQKRALAL